MRDTAHAHARRPWLKRVFRFGIAIRGLIYVLVGLVAAQIALGPLTAAAASHQSAAPTGVFAQLAEDPFGRVCLLAVAVGASAYALLMLVDATLGHADERSPMPRWGNRALSAWGLILHAMLAWQALHISVIGSGGRGTAEESLTARALRLPAGALLVAAVALILAVVTIGLLRRAVIRSDLDRLQVGEMSRTVRRATVALAVVGNVARASVAALAAYWFTRAALRHDADDAVGIDETLRSLLEAPYGSWMLLALAAGLVAFGAFTFLEARWRRLNPA